MHKHFIVGAALLLSATTAGLALAAASGENGFRAADRHERNTGSETVGQGDRPVLLASKDRIAKRDRRHHDDDDDDDEDGSRGMMPQNGPAKPAAPVPDSGLFNGNSRPKVQVQ
ncbi:hypothetical protein GGR34_002740 [Microvirga flocculans]|uniref:Uncharacterized protein n=1 Tax=Microvirga flocculans TaxID=217168 RepID=A0A7W6IGI8_9HYPH|nr:hypothetical protein [Microvirga flocculans]MBB4041077.1 hypothetical protein [Microvirga flocculans]